MDLSRKRIGIWGYGIVGKSVARYLEREGYPYCVCDVRTPSAVEQAHLKAHHSSFCHQTNVTHFLNAYDYIVPSPGIDLRPYRQFAHKWLSELDLFYSAWHKPIIAITGTVGKTTITNLLELIFKQTTLKAIVGGNIGTGMLSLVPHQEASHLALLELSSWQLEYCKLFAPSIALWTHFSENHLDRHDTMENYFNAKYQIIVRQTARDTAIAPISIMQQLYTKKPKSRCIFFCKGRPHSHQALRMQDSIISYEKSSIQITTADRVYTLADTISLPSYSFTENWLAICAVLHTLDIPLTILEQIDISSYTQPHRMELLSHINNISVYNDSKSTTVASTLASIRTFPHQRIHLFLGGLSKGADRTPIMHAIKGKDITVYCFGKEASFLQELCKQHGITAYQHATLEAAVIQCKANCREGEVILFSPAGSSFDLFKDYADRGERFKEIILSMTFQSNNSEILNR